MIGIFDSGFGGLTVLKGLLKKLPQYDYLYLGDNKRNPYGDKSQKKIYNYTRQAVNFLFEKKCFLVIVACNTASSDALKKIQEDYSRGKHSKKKILGVLLPLVEEANSKTINGRIGIIGTTFTVNSKAYEIKLSQQKTNGKKNIKTYTKACPLLVPLIEKGKIKETFAVLNNCLKPLKEKKIDTLILGCTHYYFLIENIKKIIGEKVKIINSTNVIPLKLADYLNRHPEIKNNLTKNKKRVFFTTGDPLKFKNFGDNFLGKNIITLVKKCKL